MDKVKRWKPDLDTNCPLCHSDSESREHIFFQCEFVQRVLEVCFPSNWNYRPKAGWQKGMMDAVKNFKNCKLVGWCGIWLSVRCWRKLPIRRNSGSGNKA
ncbi:unnamed protein product [Linum tenue]|uniref:Reverse transcriptase zinc-binding domain-containing protein n=1 Tax=Linum tenue TaxID=586396 RepID=A0AAV0I3C9_9ROSI|nr:unnamed protein product [Linum tenue]